MPLQLLSMASQTSEAEGLMFAVPSLQSHAGAPGAWQV
jgi:hypothetical protein